LRKTGTSQPTSIHHFGNRVDKTPASSFGNAKWVCMGYLVDILQGRIILDLLKPSLQGDK